MPRNLSRPYSRSLSAAVLACGVGLLSADEGLPLADTAEQTYAPLIGVIDVTQRVIGGNLSAPGQFPSIVALLDPGLLSPYERQFCGGTVIDERWVLTAAHCLHDAFGRVTEPAALRIVEGTLDLRNDPVVELDVTNVFIHPGYDHGSVETYNDVALLEMATELAAVPALLFDGDPENFIGETAVIAGWGAIEFLSPRFAVYPDALHHASVPLVSRDTCNGQQSYQGIIGEGQLCAGFVDGGVDSCLGDSGGPLYTNARGTVELIGVTSFGRGCAEPNFYGIYTSVASQRDWLSQYVVLDDSPRGTGGLLAGSDTGGNGLGSADDTGGSSGGGAAWWLLGLVAVGAGVGRRDR